MADSSDESIHATALVTTVPAAQAGSPLAVLRAIGGLGQRRVLLESAGAPAESAAPPTIQRSVLVARPLLHVEARKGHVRWQSLVPGGEGLLQTLQRNLPGRAEFTQSDLTARYSTTPSPGLRTDTERITQPSILDALRATHRIVRDRSPSPMPPGLFGALSYELVDHFEPLPPRKPDPLAEPDYSFVLAGDVVIFDHRLQQTTAITRCMPWETMSDAKARHQHLVTALREPGEEPRRRYRGDLSWSSTLDREPFRNGVRQFLGAIRDGQIFQGVLARQQHATTDVDALAVYGELRANNPSPYMFCLDLGDGALVGASPETFLRVEGRAIEIRPIAGTVPRGRVGDELDSDTDSRLALAMSLDPKELAEHCMLVDLARNDVARVARPGTTRVTQQMQVERYSHVQHLVSRVRGELRDGLDALHAYRAVANMGTLTGAPKPKAMELIRAAEPVARGFYGGTVGQLLADGTFDSCIAIRCARLARGRVYLHTGAGIVAASDPEREFQETAHKARAVRQAVAAAAQGGAA